MKRKLLGILIISLVFIQVLPTFAQSTILYTSSTTLKPKKTLIEVEEELKSKLEQYDIEWIDFYYDKGLISYLGENRFVYRDKENNSLLIDKNGNEIKDLGRIQLSERIVVNQGFGDGLCAFMDIKTNLYGAINIWGEVVIPAKYEELNRFNDGVALALDKDYKYGYINKKGETVIPFEYQDLGKFGDLILATKGTFEIPISGWINKSNKTIIPFVYARAWDFSDGLARVEKYDPKSYDSYVGYIDKTGKLIIPYKYSIAGDFKDGLAWASIDSRMNAAGGNDKNIGYINTKGEVVIPFKFAQANDFNEGRAVICNSSDYSTYGIIDKTGNIIKQVNHDGIVMGRISDGLAFYGYDYYLQPTVRILLHGVIDKLGNDIFKEQGRYFSTLGSFHEGLAFFREIDNIKKASTSTSTIGYIDKDFKTVVSFKGNENIEFASDFIDGIIPVTLIITNGSESIFKTGMLKNPIKSVTATPTSSKIVVNGEKVDLEVYNIDGNNYFKLRDIAHLVTKTEKQFDVTWNENEKIINLISKKPYTSKGNELRKADGTIKEGRLNLSKIHKDSEEINIKAYTINGNNYFKLRNVAETFDIGILWDSNTNTVNIDTNIGYIY